MKLSYVIPTYNEEKNISALYSRIISVNKKITPSWEIIFVIDGSTDNTLNEIRKLRSRNKRVKFISFSRNFGHMPALEAGLKYASGDHIVIMDSDLQDPPEVVLKMYKKALSGYDVVYGIKKDRQEDALKILLFDSFYKILNKISSYDMPLNAGTFSIINRKIVNILLQMPEKNKYFSGLRAWTGFKQTGITYKRGKRIHGQAMPYRKLIHLALNGMLSFSYLPLRAASLFGFLCAGLATVSIFVVIILRLFLGFGLIGWASTMSTILLVSGVQLITLGIIGEYLARIYDEMKRRPEYIIEESQGF